MVIQYINFNGNKHGKFDKMPIHVLLIFQIIRTAHLKLILIVISTKRLEDLLILFIMIWFEDCVQVLGSL